MTKQLTSAVISKRISWIFAFIIVLLPYHAFFTTWAGSNFGHLDLFRIWKEVILLLISPLIVFLVIKDEKIRSQLFSNSLIRLITAYLAIFIILGIWALSRNKVNQTALVYSLIINLRYLVFFVFCLIVANYSDFLRSRWKALIILPSIPVILFGIAQKLLLPLNFLAHFGYGENTIPTYQTVDSNLHYQRIQSTLRGSNPLGAYFVLLITVLTVWLKNKKIKLLTGAAFVALFYTYSRSAWIGLILSLAFLGLLTVDFKHKTKVILSVGLAALTIFSFSIYTFRNNQVFQDTFFHTTSSSVNKSSNEYRYNAMKNAVNDIASSPLGDGPGSAGPASFRNNQPPKISENYFLQIGQEVGVLGLAIFLAINFMVAKYLWLQRKDELSSILLASFFGITLINLLSHAWADDTLSYLWWGLAGVALSPAILNLKAKNESK